MSGGHYYYPPSPPQRPATRPDLPAEKTPTEDRLIQDYQNIRLDISEIEQLVGSETDLSDEEKKTLDKAIVLMRVGSKMVKRVLRRRGFDKRLTPKVAETSKAE